MFLYFYFLLLSLSVRFALFVFCFCLFVLFCFLFIQYFFVMSFVSLCFCVLFILYFSFYAYTVYSCAYLIFLGSVYPCMKCMFYIIASVCLYLVCLCILFDWLQNHITFCVQLNIIADVFFCYFSLVAERKCFEC